MHTNAFLKTSNYSRHLRPNDAYDNNVVYGSASNHIAASYKSSHEILPSKLSNKWSSSTRHTPENSKRTTYGTYTSFYSTSISPPKSQSPSPPSNAKPHNSVLSSKEVVRPAMRARESSYSPLTNGYSTSFASRPRSISPSANSYDRNINLHRQRPLPVAPSRSPSNSDIKYSTTSSLDDRSILYSKNGTNLKSREEISIEKSPYASSSYQPSFAASRSPSPKRSYESSKSKNVSSKSEGQGITGLKNIGNTCFMNSILQCLSNTSALRDYCLSSHYEGQINESSPMKGKLMRAFAEVIKDLWSDSSSSVTPSNFKHQIQKFSPRFMGYEQQDSQEFLRFLLEGLHEDINQVTRKSSEPLRDLSHKSPQEIARETWKWYGKKDRSYIFDLFVGQLESSLECDTCGHVSLTYDPFWDLSLPISKNSYSNDTSTLNECLRVFTREEVLDRDEKPMCERCKQRRRMKKKLSIHRFPKILVIHLKRFNEGSRYRQKLSNLVKFPVYEPLRLVQFASDTSEDKNSSNYELYAVSNHCGSCYGGHYTAYCLNPRSEQWYEFNDSRVVPTNSHAVCTKEAYVLFYVQQHGGRSSRL